MTELLEAPNGATALQLLLAAERLFAERGIDGVSLRQIGAEAGSSNNSAIQYHYGSKDHLLRAILAYRLSDLLRRRTLLEARADPDDLRARFEAYILPLLELAESPESSYVSFIEQLMRSGAAEVFANQPEVQQSQDKFLADMRRLLDHLPEPARTMRIKHTQQLAVHLAAERERAVSRGGEIVPFGAFVSSVLDGFAGWLRAAASDETLRLATRANMDRPRRRRRGPGST